jgi:hypothetical protein
MSKKKDHEGPIDDATTAEVVGEQWRSFPSQMPDNGLKIVLDAWRGAPVDQDEAVLAAHNVTGFAYKAGFAKAGITQLAAPRPEGDNGAQLEYDAKVEAAFRTLLPDEGGIEAASEVDKANAWAIIIPIVLDLLSKWLGRR